MYVCGIDRASAAAAVLYPGVGIGDGGWDFGGRVRNTMFFGRGRVRCDAMSALHRLTYIPTYSQYLP